MYTQLDGLEFYLCLIHFPRYFNCFMAVLLSLKEIQHNICVYFKQWCRKKRLVDKVYCVDNWCWI